MHRLQNRHRYVCIRKTNDRRAGRHGQRHQFEKFGAATDLSRVRRNNKLKYMVENKYCSLMLLGSRDTV